MKKLNNIFSSLSVVLMLLMYADTNAQVPERYRATDAENKVAILPIVYVGEGSTVKMEEMRYRLQNMAYIFLQESAIELKFQSPAETNALLLKKGINESNFREFTPKELATILEVEYVLTGMVNQETIGEHSVGNTVNHYSNNNRGNKNGNNRRHTTEQFRTRQDISTSIDLSIYNDKGEAVFSKSRHSIWSSATAYTNAMEFLLKKSPLYKR